MASSPNSISKLKIPTLAKKFIQEKWGISELYPPQKEALKPVLKGENTLISIPTASGKSLIAYLGIIQNLLIKNVGSKAVYIVPLKALAGEKFSELSEIGKFLNLKVGLALGDRDGENTNINNADIIICTSEKFDSIMRNRPEIMQGLSIIIADEVHLIHDFSRGPTMEINLTRFLFSNKNVQIIALSATIGNSVELAKWLQAKLIVSTWRPVVLEQSTLANIDLEARKRICSSKETMTKLPPPRTLKGPASQPMVAALEDSLEQNIQSLIFVSTRRSAQSLARKLSERVVKKWKKENLENKINELEGLKKELKQIGDDSSISDSLLSIISGGIAFHHAGLNGKQRRFIEDAFRNKKISCIVATPTLASGVNLPARRVIIRDLKRYDQGMSRWLSVMEVQQMLGRAGRPKYDSIGEAWLHCKGDRSFENADNIAERFIHGNPEDVSSKLASENALRIHLLALIATGGINSRFAISNFFKHTFLGHTQPQKMLEERIEKWIQWLSNNDLVSRLGCDDDLYQHITNEDVDENESWNDEIPTWANIAKDSEGVQLEPVSNSISNAPKSLGFNLASDWDIRENTPKTVEPLVMTYAASEFGILVNRMYLDPTSGLLMREGLRRAVRRIYRDDSNLPLTDEGLLYLISSTDDFMTFWWKDSEYDKLLEKASLLDNELLNEKELEDIHLSRIKSTWILNDWIEEAEYRDLEKIHKIMPGDLRARVELAEWLLFSAKQILYHDTKFNNEFKDIKNNVINRLDDLRKRIRYGCKKELLPLVTLPNIGRKRARDLVNMGVNTPRDILELTPRDKDRLISLQGWGPKLIENLIKKIKNNKSDKNEKRRDDEPLPGEK
ncbi:MAG: putative helicase HelY [Methanobacteriota archaeon]|nr:MAG: putative helicase HelY [Euryarchaeota archaeon]